MLIDIQILILLYLPTNQETHFIYQFSFFSYSSEWFIKYSPKNLIGFSGLVFASSMQAYVIYSCNF